jgi:hypothetical protein
MKVFWQFNRIKVLGGIVSGCPKQARPYYVYKTQSGLRIEQKLHELKNITARDTFEWGYNLLAHPQFNKGEIHDQVDADSNQSLYILWAATTQLSYQPVGGWPSARQFIFVILN